MSAVALGVGQFVIAFYGSAPSGAVLRVQREPFVTRFQSSVSVARQLWTEGFALDDRQVEDAQFALAVREGHWMGERLHAAQRALAERQPPAGEET